MGSKNPASDPRFHGRRRGRRLRQQREELLAARLPALELSLPADGGAVDPAAQFAGPVRDVWLEIGFGYGEHLIWQAQNHRDIGIIGAEPFLNGVARLVSYIAEGEVDNVRIVPDDVRPVLDRLPAASLGRVFILFPDPWPKLRHRKRRLVSAETLDQLARVMSDGAELRLATDDADYAAWMLRLGLAHREFEWTARRPDDWRQRPDDWPSTRYEEKNRSGGQGPVFLRFRRHLRD
ncbi:MAG: tRNA (guanosine(46)-N7)-methyltransferase TrmB [Alphaproteobacteria bacterium]|nr:tRNA (guanosine(46)-N7)-methyltransferase TrmB [Alphaproteobacteria bacterium]